MRTRQYPQLQAWLWDCLGGRSPNQANGDKQHNSACNRRDDRRDETTAYMDVQLTSEPPANERPNDPDGNVAEQTKSPAFDKRSGCPTGDSSDNQPRNQTVAIHDILPLY